jgi:hypothetical protein
MVLMVAESKFRGLTLGPQAPACPFANIPVDKDDPNACSGCNYFKKNQRGQ